MPDCGKKIKVRHSDDFAMFILWDFPGVFFAFLILICLVISRSCLPIIFIVASATHDALLWSPPSPGPCLCSDTLTLCSQPPSQVSGLIWSIPFSWKGVPADRRFLQTIFPRKLILIWSWPIKGVLFLSL